MPKNTEWREEATNSTRNIATKAVAALTVVIVLSYGLVSMKSVSTYAVSLPQMGALTDKNAYLGAAAGALDHVGGVLETILTEELVYIRATKK